MRLTRRERDTIDTAWHEAGHAAIAIALGLRVASVRAKRERATVGRTVGLTQLDLAWAVVTDRQPDVREWALHVLAGDAVRWSGAHVLDVVDRLGKERFDELWAEANLLVVQHRTMIEEIALALLAQPDLSLYDADLRRWQPESSPGLRQRPRRARRQVAPHQSASR